MYPSRKFPDFFVFYLDFATQEVRKRFLITKFSGTQKLFRGQHAARERQVERALISEITGRNMYLPSGKLVSRTVLQRRTPTYARELINSMPKKNQ